MLVIVSNSKFRSNSCIYRQDLKCLYTMPRITSLLRRMTFLSYNWLINKAVHTHESLVGIDEIYHKTDHYFEVGPIVGVVFVYS